ncbi:MAG: PadR family transcriptional regulator [Spirochaetaceae bacterium]|jgi:DNA-binding PadR family transcriptional regulator|nr:PadR family transcriptional regulator [Spirochaetaceae bacterium]
MEDQLVSGLLRGHTDTIILRLLLDGDAYGYELYSRILERTGEQHEIKETTLYSSVKRLEGAKCVKSYWGNETQGARRKYYHLTGAGRKVFEKNLADWRAAKKLMDTLLGIDD